MQKRDFEVVKKLIEDQIIDREKLADRSKTSLERPDANNNAKHGDIQMKEELEDMKKTVTDIKYMMFLMIAVMTLRFMGFL